MLRFVRLVPLGLLIAVLAGCEAPLPERAAPTQSSDPVNAFEEWQTIAAQSPVVRDVERAVELTSILAETGPEGLGPMVGLLAEEAVPAEHKVFALICLTTQRDRLAVYAPRLLGWVEAGKAPETRKFSAHLLGLLDTPEALDRMKQLLDDGDRAVREAAMGVMLSFHPEFVSDRMDRFWHDPETSPAIRDQVILGMPPHLVEQFVSFYREAVSDGRLSVTARLKAIHVLGQRGSAGDIPVLEECIEKDPDAVVKEQARGALALLRVTAGTATAVSE